MNLKILNWNLNSIKNKLPELQILLAQNSPDIILLQETRLKPIENFILKNYALFRKDLASDSIAKGGVLIGVSNNIHTTSEPSNRPSSSSNNHKIPL